jgi:hypothetical protein
MGRGRQTRANPTVAAAPSRTRRLNSCVSAQDPATHVGHQKLLPLVEDKGVQHPVHLELAAPRQAVGPHLERLVVLVVAGAEEAQEGVVVCIGGEGVV